MARRGLSAGMSGREKALGGAVLALYLAVLPYVSGPALDLLERGGHAGADRGELPGGADFFVTPREVDQRVAELGKVLGYAISLALNPSLTLDDLVMLLE